ncbi:MAG: phospho-N-acetylmuramoyl-pentapeptide-transferase [Lachnospiraceae bacterium]|nr:phospho-N-acetylmuramoyl-pentapeptide-transferase [Lachnospiraceae bacterium]
MLYLIPSLMDYSHILTLCGVLLSFFLTVFITNAVKGKLPTDIGRAYAVNAQAAKGKPRGAGIIFVLISAVLMMIFCRLSIEYAVYAVMLVCAMLSGYLDDASRNPWSEYKKALIDLVISVITALIFALCNGTDIKLLIMGTTVTLPVWLYVILGSVLVWASINVTNCTDGVDGLSSTLSLISLGGFAYAFSRLGAADAGFIPAILIFAASIAAYLLFNASRSLLLMGDAGSRAIGVFFAICSMKSGSPLIFLALCLVFILDGGLGLIKVALKRFLKIEIFVNTRMPLHDHFRKNKSWDDAQTVARFMIIHLLVVFVTLWLLV